MAHTCRITPPRRGQTTYSVSVRCPDGRKVVIVKGFASASEEIDARAESVARELDAGTYVGPCVVNLTRRAR